MAIKVFDFSSLAFGSAAPPTLTLIKVNAIALFVGTGLMARLMGMSSGFMGRFTSMLHIRKPDGSPMALQPFIYNHVFTSWLPPKPASLAFALSFILLWLFLMWLLFRKNIIVKI